MFSFGNSNYENFTPYPSFYSMYYFRKYCGDILLNHTVHGGDDIVVFPTRFSSKQLGITLINKGTSDQTVSIIANNFENGSRYYTYCIRGEAGTDFSNEVYINNVAPSKGFTGPENYRSIKSNSSIIDSDINVVIPPFSMMTLLIDSQIRNERNSDKK